ncbi:BlaR1 peptidase M56 [Singulisphaera sp. GP187]|uniref:M56 family metallopeptidase n=1 Tax=Singulisphaera sp. GP187 TaxID=1882752 RepID=UPI00092C9D23|nr:M56 family metallopeptidase [Singulisphaera sp. GP187]SIO61983.1 BlaR1 peptidase M56 [Singulisphaera sp. GP187]
MQTLATEALQGLIGGLVWLGLLHSIWLGLVMAALVSWGFQTQWVRSHRSRHAALLLALGVVAFSPLVLTAVQYLTAVRHSTGDSVSAATTAVIVPGDSTGRLRGAPPLGKAPNSGGISHAIRLLQVLDLTRDRVVVVARVIRPYALMAWALVVLGLSTVLALGIKGLHQLCRDAAPAPRSVDERVQRLGRLLRLRIIPAIRVHLTLDEPCLCGLFRPVILLPERWLATAGTDSLEAVLAHELAHARRSDHLVNLAQRILESLLFFHPGVHWLSRSLRYQRELCADALAVRLTGDPMALARALESVARLRVGPPLPRRIGAAFGGESSSLLPRIQELIGMTPIRSRPQAWPIVALVSAVAVALVAASIGFAEEQPSPSRPPSGPSLEVKQDTRLREDTTLVPLPVPASPPMNEAVREISYEVRFVEREPDAWRLQLQGQLTALDPQTGMNGWLIDQSALLVFIEQMRDEANSNLVQAPKVTAFENAHAFVINRPGNLQNASGQMKRIAKVREGERKKDAGVQVNVSGMHLLKATRLTVLVSEPTLITGQTGPSSDPGAVFYSYSTGKCDVPEGSSLVLSLGSHVRGVGPQSALSERLILITPRQIVRNNTDDSRSTRPPLPLGRPPGR